jgi:Predicted periplasmic ligand-binding sensor domain
MLIIEKGYGFSLIKQNSSITGVTLTKIGRDSFFKSTVDTQGNLVRAILDDGNGHVWIGTDHKGVFVYDVAKKSLANYTNDPWLKNSIASNNVEHIYCDDNGIIWLGHNKQGLSYYHESFHKFVNVQYQDCQDISVILEDKHGNIWLGTDGNGLFIKEKRLRKFASFLSLIIP